MGLRSLHREGINSGNLLQNWPVSWSSCTRGILPAASCPARRIPHAHPPFALHYVHSVSLEDPDLPLLLRLLRHKPKKRKTGYDNDRHRNNRWTKLLFLLANLPVPLPSHTSSYSLSNEQRSDQAQIDSPTSLQGYMYVRIYIYM